ncbi:MAG: hypothetical protein HY616_03410, partial [Candidatus Rokubacteria bacterium]|nr:hypothetical protein [Candidatus Rokubacteria bacterium]
MRGAWAPAVALAGALLCAPAAPGAAAPEPAREQALAALADQANVESRRRGAQGLGETGTMADLPALARA